MGTVEGYLSGGPVMAGAGLLGAFAGAVGTLPGSRRVSTRDGVYGGRRRERCALRLPVRAAVGAHRRRRGRPGSGGGLALGPLGMRFGLPGLEIAFGLGAVAGAVSTRNLLRKREKAGMAANSPGGSRTQPSAKDVAA